MRGQTPIYSVKGVLFTSALLYAACVALFADVRDGKPAFIRIG